MGWWQGTFGYRPAVTAIGCLSTILSIAAADSSPIPSWDRGVSVRLVHSGEYVDLVVENRRLNDITLTLQITGSNVTISRFAPETATYPSHCRVVAAQLSTADATKRPNLRYHFNWVKGDMHAKHDSSAVYRLPFESGTSHRVTQGYNGVLSHQGPDQYAVDFAMPEGTTVCAARDGIVVDLRKSSEGGGADEEYRRQSNFVSILHEDGTIAEYLHVQHNGVLVEIGQRVTAGTPIALSGNTGYSSRPHLHLGVYSAVDGTHVQSHPMTFTTRQGIITEPVQGRLYTAK